jgi:hypothetical protein
MHAKRRYGKAYFQPCAIIRCSEVEMEDADSSGPVLVTDLKAAQVLTDLRQYAFLEPFFGQEKSISEVAAELDLRVDAAFYRVRRYWELGILRIARTTLRAGREINLYSSAPEGYFIPLEKVPFATVEEWLQTSNSYFEQAITQGVSKAIAELGDDATPIGFRIVNAGPGKISVDLATPSGNAFEMLTGNAGPAVLNASTSLYLDYEDAKSLQHALVALLKRYGGRKGRQQYFVRLGLAPIDSN